jgi:hypothetical protein
MALPPLSHFPLWDVFLDRAQAMLPLRPDLVMYGRAVVIVMLFLSGCA